MTDVSAREQLVAGAADMMRRRGLNATSIREVARHSGAPLGSTYHYFPGGKDELAAEAVRYAAGTVGGILAAKLRVGPVEGLSTALHTAHRHRAFGRGNDKSGQALRPDSPDAVLSQRLRELS